jgi:hypothetical protein
MGEPPVITREFADHLADQVERNFVTGIDGSDPDAKMVMAAYVRACVLQALGCICRRRLGNSEGTVFFEDLMCAVHGIGPFDYLIPPNAHPDPGD